MAEFEIFETEPFHLLFEKLDKREQEWIHKMKYQLQANPFAGKPLHFEWFREKKFENKRLYYIVSQQYQRVLIFGFGNKKEQQKIINHLLLNKEKYWVVLGQL